VQLADTDIPNTRRTPGDESDPSKRTAPPEINPETKDPKNRWRQCRSTDHASITVDLQERPPLARVGPRRRRQEEPGAMALAALDVASREA